MSWGTPPERSEPASRSNSVAPVSRSGTWGARGVSHASAARIALGSRTTCECRRIRWTSRRSWQRSTVTPAASRRGYQAVVSLHTQRSEEHTSELQSRGHLVCRLLLEKKKEG